MYTSAWIAIDVRPTRRTAPSGTSASFRRTPPRYVPLRLPRSFTTKRAPTGHTVACLCETENVPQHQGARRIGADVHRVGRAASRAPRPARRRRRASRRRAPCSRRSRAANRPCASPVGWLPRHGRTLAPDRRVVESAAWAFSPAVLPAPPRSSDGLFPRGDDAGRVPRFCLMARAGTGGARR